MAKKISQLTQATEVKSDDVTVIVQDGETKKLPLNMMVTKQDIENKKIAGLAKLDEIEATYENDTYTPTITVKNKSSVKTGEGDEVDYSANVMDGHAKSAILSGQTLVNLATLNSVTYSGNTTIAKRYRLKETYFKQNTDYLLLYKSNIETTNVGFQTYDSDYSFVSLIIPSLQKEGIVKFNSGNAIGVRTNSNNDFSETITISDIMLIEYQEGMENWDIPYFEGMQSVKMPVLTTTGKNLFDKELFKRNASKIPTYRINESVVTWQNSGVSANYTLIDGIFKENTQYTFSLKTGLSNNVNLYIWYADNTKKRFDGNIVSVTGKTIRKITPVHSDGSYSTLDINDFQIEESPTATTYEPHKSNILTVNEDVTLRGIEDVQDTLDCLTGEVTERIVEVVLDGSNDEKWILNTTKEKTQVFKLNIPDAQRTDNAIICDKLPTAVNGDVEKIASGFNTIDSTSSLYIALLKTKASTVGELRTYLTSNPIVVQYTLETETIKTVDLMPSGTHPSTTPYCWKNGHIQLSSSGLLPNLEYSVVTSRAGQINQNATMIVKNDKRIFDLEILLAGGLVNTTYQALTLQNQVETGLSKVSLNSETEPDYLLYHMIMKLIEEKAYKLDDLTEKVSVFYLYEKLSDEQFETIYSALYPFVEDEIVEEPVVEELPEVVEDEVIM